MNFPASLGRRFLALCIDWILISGPISGLILPNPNGAGLFLTTGVFVFEVSLMTHFTGGSIGQLPLKLRVLDYESGSRPTLLQILVRTALIALVIPAIFTHQGRGLHDVIARTQIVKVAAV